jgi:hypothetical protein
MYQTFKCFHSVFKITDNEYLSVAVKFRCVSGGRFSEPVVQVGYQLSSVKLFIILLRLFRITLINNPLPVASRFLPSQSNDYLLTAKNLRYHEGRGIS